MFRTNASNFIDLNPPQMTLYTDKEIHVMWSADPTATAFVLEMSENDTSNFHAVYLLPTFFLFSFFFFDEPYICWY